MPAFAPLTRGLAALVTADLAKVSALRVVGRAQDPAVLRELDAAPTPSLSATARDLLPRGRHVHDRTPSGLPRGVEPRGRLRAESLPTAHRRLLPVERRLCREHAGGLRGRVLWDRYGLRAQPLRRSDRRRLHARAEGVHPVFWNGRGERGEAAAGTYFVRVRSASGVNKAERVAVTRMVKLR